MYALSLKQRDKEEKYAHKQEIGKEEKFDKMKKRAKTSDAMTFKKGTPTTQREQTTLPPQNRLGASSNPEQELFKEFQKFLAAKQSSVHGETVQLPTIPAQQSFPNTSRGGGNPRRGKVFPKLKLFTPKKKAKSLVLGVHNLSKKFQLNVPTAILLSKGHKFVPSNPNISDKAILQHLPKLRLDLYKKAFFHHNPGLGEVYNPDLKVKSGWLPPADRNVDNFMADLTRKLEKMVQEDNENFCNSGAKHFKNLSNQQLKALKNLKHNQAIVIKMSDKNLGLTIMDFEWYDAECLRQLSDRYIYIYISN